MFTLKRSLSMLILALFAQGASCVSTYAASQNGAAAVQLDSFEDNWLFKAQQGMPSQYRKAEGAASELSPQSFAQAKQESCSKNCSADATCELPKVIARAVLRNAAKCGFKGGELPKNSWSVLDFNGDGKVDYLVNYGKLTCGKTPTYFGFTRGSYHELWLSTRLSWELAYAKELLGVIKVEPQKGRDIVTTRVHPSYCKLKAGDCQQQLRWTGSRVEETGGHDEMRAAPLSR